jgi:hypothetical protein
LRNVTPLTGVSRGTPAPGEGYALTIAHHALAGFVFEHEHDRHDVELGIGLVAAKRASLVGRGPTLADVHVAMDLFGLHDAHPVSHHQAAPFAGVAHSYVRQRALVDSVEADDLLASA